MELERSISQHANLGSASFSKGKPTSRYTFIPKSDSPGPIYDIRTSPGKRTGTRFAAIRVYDLSYLSQKAITCAWR